MLQSVEALDYDGILVATDIFTSHILKNCLRAQKKYVYVWNVDWNIQNRPANFIKDTYLVPETELIARSEDHAKLIGRVFRQPQHIIEEFNHEQIIDRIV